MEDQFTNEQIEVSSLPLLENIKFVKLHREYFTANLISNGIFWSIVIVGALLWFWLHNIDYERWIDNLGLGFILFLALLSFWLEYKGFQYKGYALRERDIVYKEGFIWRSLTSIPFNRIQHAEVQQGPIDRMFGLGRVNIYTAGGSSSDLTIPGLRPEEAESIKFFVLNKSARDEEE